MKKFVLSVIVTAYNEEKGLSRIIQDIKKYGENIPLEIIVVDDASKDKTSFVAKKYHADQIIRHKINLGKGGAFQTGIKHAKGKYIIQIDADYQFLPSEIPVMLSYLKKGYDVVLGTRYQKGSKVDEDSVNYLRHAGSYFLSYVTSVFAGKRITDVMAGFKGFSSEALKQIEPKTNHFGYEAEVVIKAAQKGYKIKNIPISYRRRADGKSSVNSFRHGFLVLQTIIKTGLRLQ